MMRTKSLQYTRPREGRRAKIFVGGLSRDSTDMSLKKYFQQFGQVTSAEVLRDHQTMCSRGFGFVTFASEDIADRIILAGLSRPHVVDGKQVEVKVAVPKEETNTRSKSGLYRNHPNRSSLTGTRTPFLRSNSLPEDSLFTDFSFTDTLSSVSSYSTSPMSTIDPSVSLSRGTSFGGPYRGEKTDLVANKIFVGGLMYSTGHERLRKYFQKFGDIVTAEVIYNRDTKKSRGFGFVVFTDSTPLRKIMQIQSYEPLMLDGKQIEVKLCKPKEGTYQPEQKTPDFSDFMMEEMAKDFSTMSFNGPTSPFDTDRTLFGGEFERSYSYMEDNTRYDNFCFSYDLPGRLPSILESN